MGEIVENRIGDPEDSGVVGSGRSGPGAAGRRPGLGGLVWAVVVVLVVGGFALSQDYVVQDVPTSPELGKLPSPSTSSPPRSSTTLRELDPFFLNWFVGITDLIDGAIGADGSVVVSSQTGIARLDSTGNWRLIPTFGLPSGTWMGRVPGREITHIATAPDGTLWSAGHVFEETMDSWFGFSSRVWVAFLCPSCGEWQVLDGPEPNQEIGDLIVSADGTVYLSADRDQLIAYDGDGWESHTLPLEAGAYSVSPWSSSLAVGDDGVVWAATDFIGGVFAFDGIGFTRPSAGEGLPSDAVRYVAVAADGMVWAATEGAGVASFDGDTWTTYTTEDGLLSDNGSVAAGPDGTVWVVHYEYPPYGYSRFDGLRWTSYPSDHEVAGSWGAVDSDGKFWTVLQDVSSDQGSMWWRGSGQSGLVSFDGSVLTVHPAPFIQQYGPIYFTPADWGVYREVDQAPGVYFVHMIVDVRPLTREVQNVSGRLIWDEKVVDLCQIGFDIGDGFLQVGDIFQTSEGCGTNPAAMQDAFDEFGLPETACVTVTVGTADHEYCAPLPATADAAAELARQTVTVVLDDLAGLEGMAVDVLVTPSLEDESDVLEVLGGIRFGVIGEDPFSTSEVIHPGWWDPTSEEALIFESGVYRFIIEVYVPSGDMYFGCETAIQIIDDQPLVVTIAELPPYTGSGIHYTPVEELEYPDCPG